MKIAIIGRTEVLYSTALLLRKNGHEIVLILTAKEAPEYTRTARDFQSLAEEWKIPFAQGPRIADYANLIQSTDADIAISMNYPVIIPQSVIDQFPFGVLNVHCGDLPRYRGNACFAWAILNGEDRIGLCVHRMIGGELDSGDILAREYLTIDLSTTITQVWGWLAARTPMLVQKAIRRLEQDPDYVLESQSNDSKQALRCYPRRPEDGRIDWCRPAIDVLRLINASNKPYSGAFCTYDGETMIIWDAALVIDDEKFCAIPGQVTARGDRFVDVACGVGKLRIRQVEIQGKVMFPAALIQSIRKRLK